jgi:uncharacterized protein (DUF433 family)
MTYDEIVWTDPERPGGTPCFRGTRVPVRGLFDHPVRDYSTNEFLEQFPTVKREQAEAAVALAGQVLVAAAVVRA